MLGVVLDPSDERARRAVGVELVGQIMAAVRVFADVQRYGEVAGHDAKKSEALLVGHVRHGAAKRNLEFCEDDDCLFHALIIGHEGAKGKSVFLRFVR